MKNRFRINGMKQVKFVLHITYSTDFACTC